MIRQHYIIRAPIERVWQALTDARQIEKWTDAPAEMTEQRGADFKLWNGDIWGINTFVKAPAHLEQDWYGGQWDHPSKVCIALTSDDKATEIELCQEGVPKDEEPKFAEGWQSEYFGPLQTYLEDAAST